MSTNQDKKEWTYQYRYWTNHERIRHTSVLRSHDISCILQETTVGIHGISDDHSKISIIGFKTNEKSNKTDKNEEMKK